MPRYPGLGLDLRCHDDSRARYSSASNACYPIGIYRIYPGSQSDLLLIREVAMMIIMDRLTAKHDWQVKVFDDAIAHRWIEEALALADKELYDEIVQKQPYSTASPRRLKSILDRRCAEYCIKELRTNAAVFKQYGFVPTLDACATVVKSDSLVDQALHDDLDTAFVKLRKEQGYNLDWHPHTNEKLLNLIHPSLYPLVYGRSRVFADEVVGVEDAIDKWAGKGDVIPIAPEPEPQIVDNVPYSFWSSKHQWLPSNVKLQQDGSVKFTSYINGLHPTRHQDVYGTIEKLIEKSLPAWDFCLALYQQEFLEGAGRTRPRFPCPEDPDDENPDNWSPKFEDFIPPRGAEKIFEQRSRHGVNDSSFDLWLAANFLRLGDNRPQSSG